MMYLIHSNQESYKNVIKLRDNLSEWLRRWTRNHLQIAVGSNPIVVDL